MISCVMSNPLPPMKNLKIHGDTHTALRKAAIAEGMKIGEIADDAIRIDSRVRPFIQKKSAKKAKTGRAKP